MSNRAIIWTPEETGACFVQSPTGRIFHVTSDVKIRTAADAIGSTGCEVKWGLAETPEKIPMAVQPADCRVRAIRLGKVMTTEEVYKAFPKIVAPAELFSFGAKFPEEQREVPHFTVWRDATGRFFYAFLGVYGGRRFVGVFEGRPVVRWFEFCRVLVRE